MPYANNKGADQPAHSRSLISTFVVCCLDSIISLVSISEISSLYLASVAAHASLSLTWSEIPKTGFLVTRLIWKQRKLQTKSHTCGSIAWLHIMVFKENYLLNSKIALLAKWFRCLIFCVPASPYSTWSKTRDILAVVTMVTGISYAAYRLYQVMYTLWKLLHADSEISI